MLPIGCLELEGFDLTTYLDVDLPWDSPVSFWASTRHHEAKEDNIDDIGKHVFFKLKTHSYFGKKRLAYRVSQRESSQYLYVAIRVGTRENN